MVVKGNAYFQHAARKHAGDQAPSPRVASTGLSKPRGKQSKAHQRTKTQRTTTRPTKKTSKLKGQNHTISTKGVKGKPNDTKRSQKDTAATALSPQAHPQPNNPKKKLLQSTSPSKPKPALRTIPEPSCDDEIRDDDPSLASPPKYDGVVLTADASAPEAAQSSTSTSAAVPTDLRQNNALHFASTLIEEVVDSCTEDIGAIKAVFDTLSPKTIATDNSDSSVHAKEPVPATLAPPIAKEFAPIVKASVSHTHTHRRHHTFPAQVSCGQILYIIFVRTKAFIIALNANPFSTATKVFCTETHRVIAWKIPRERCGSTQQAEDINGKGRANNYKCTTLYTTIPRTFGHAPGGFQGLFKQPF